MPVTDPFNLQRFVDAQDPVIDQVLAELRSGRKQSHWMWFVFPQLRGLGHSATARHYAIEGSAEARAYLAHPRLGPRLQDCCQLLLSLDESRAEAVLGGVDALKLQSCMTLFAAVSNADIFQRVLQQYYAGETDGATLAILARENAAG
jgi:uncharacterized protein (DUF1810 family)